MPAMKRILFFLVVLATMMTEMQPSVACTSVIVSGSVTKDGRPMIFKHRDSGKQHNMMLVVEGRRYRYLAMVNAKDTKPLDVWGGHNEAGFGIVNTAAYNLNGNGGDTDGDGILMRKALELCATLEDFECLLDTVKKPCDVNSNFAVLDAKGGCAYYETGNYKYVKFDVNDPNVAPDGYLMRTNFGTTGNHKLDQGVERYQAITDFMVEACKAGNLEHDYLVTHISRYLKHGMTKVDMYDNMPESGKATKYFSFHDYITRYNSASVILVQGVRPEESPLNTVSWTIMGWPLATVAMPLTLLPSGQLPAMVTDDGTGHSRLCEMGLQLKSRVFSLKKGNNTKFYGNLAVLFNKQGTGMLQQILPVEEEVMRRGEEAVTAWRMAKDAQAMETYYDWVDGYLTEQYKSRLGVE